MKINPLFGIGIIFLFSGIVGLWSYKRTQSLYPEERLPRLNTEFSKVEKPTQDETSAPYFVGAATETGGATITVTYPNGDETWRPKFQGGYATQTVTWRYTGGSHVDGYLYRTSGKTVYHECSPGCGVVRLQFNAPASDGTATLSLPENIISANDYRIHLSLGGVGDKQVAEDDSDTSFTIIAQ